jgi:hypothetical protein
VQDTIPRGGKFLSAYKRNGQRVVINKIGDIVVSALDTCNECTHFSSCASHCFAGAMRCQQPYQAY